MNNNDLPNIVYISLPENIRPNKSLPVDPAVLLPVEIDPDRGYADLTNLSWEMIIAAMLKIMAHDPEHKDVPYYRDLVLATRPDINREMTQAAIVKIGEKDFDIAEEIFQSLINLQPEDPTARLNLSLLFEERADSYASLNRNDLADFYNEKAFESYKLLIAAAPDLADAHFNFGMFYLKTGNLDKVSDHFDIFLKKSSDGKRNKQVKNILEQINNKKNSDSLFLGAYDAIKMGKEEEAIKIIKNFLEIEPSVWNAWFLLGWAYRRIEKYTEGVEAFMKALELGSDQLDLYNELAICLMELDKLDESRNYLLEALRAEPDNIKILSNLGILSLKENNTEAAEEYFRSVLAIAPDDKIASEYLSRIV